MPRKRNAHFVVDNDGLAIEVTITDAGLLLRPKGQRGAKPVNKTWKEVLGTITETAGVNTARWVTTEDD